MKEYKFTAAELEAQIPTIVSKGITELTIVDDAVAHNKKKVLRIINLINQHAPEVFVSIYIDASIIDREIASAATQIFCSFDIPLNCQSKGGKLLFDKKFYSNKARLLNDFGLVFGFHLLYASEEGDSLKAFMDRLDFAVQQYPNHIDFPQTQSEEYKTFVTGLFSAKDIRYARDVAFACRTFYTAGRAVPWFLSVLKPLRIYASRFFADFAEWQRCNNCDYKSGFTPEAQGHKDIEKMQLLFLDVKYEEKNQHELIPLVHDIVAINGAMSRLAGENEESIVVTSYAPEDLLSEEALDLPAFSENVCMEHSSVRIFAGDDGVDFEIL